VVLENKAQKLKRESLEGLPAIVAATQSEIGYMFAPLENAEWLNKNGLVEFDVSITNEAGFIATRATTKGIEKVMSENVQVEAAAPVASGYVIEDIAVEVVSKRRGGGRAGVSYPFDALQVGQSFVVPATEKKPNPVKSMASSITAANARYATPLTNEDGSPKMKTITVPRTGEKRDVQATQLVRKFTVVACEGGARVGRVL